MKEGKMLELVQRKKKKSGKEKKLIGKIIKGV